MTIRPDRHQVLDRGRQPRAADPLRPRAAGRLGLTLGDVAAVVRSKVQGDVATDIQREDRTIDIRLRAEESSATASQDLRQLTVVQQGKTAIPLSAVADVEEVEGPGRDPALGGRSGRRGHGQPGRPRSGLGLRGDHRRARLDEHAARLRLAHRRPAPGDGDLVRQHEAGDLPRRLHGLPGDGLAVRVAAAPVRDPVQRAVRADRLAGHAGAVRRDDQHRRADRGSCSPASWSTTRSSWSTTPTSCGATGMAKLEALRAGRAACGCGRS